MIRSLNDEAGVVGKIIVVWLLVVGLLGIAAVDATSILFTKFRLSNLAVDVANDAANALVRGSTPAEACDIAVATVEDRDPDARLAKAGCKIDTTTTTVTIDLRKTASTIVVGRVSFTEDLARVRQSEAVKPGEL